MSGPTSGVRTKTSVVLFVEDNVDLREVYGIALRDAGLLVAEAATIAEARVIAPRLLPDLVVLDRYLADGDAWSVARALKADPLTRAAPILGFTASKGRGDVEGALVAGCDAFLEKPCTPEQLVRLALGLLGLPLPEERGSGATPKLA